MTGVILFKSKYGATKRYAGWLSQKTGFACMETAKAEIPCFYCRGAWNMEKMSFTDRSLCKLLIKSVQKKKPEDCAVWEKALLEAGNQACDWTDEAYLEPILKEIYR